MSETLVLRRKGIDYPIGGTPIAGGTTNNVWQSIFNNDSVVPLPNSDTDIGQPFMVGDRVLINADIGSVDIAVRELDSAHRVYDLEARAAMPSNRWDIIFGTDGHMTITPIDTNDGTLLSVEVSRKVTVGDGTKGDVGISAYQVWLDAGNTGSEQDFLDGLKGDDGQDGDPGSVVLDATVQQAIDDTVAQVVNVEILKDRVANDPSNYPGASATLTGDNPVVVNVAKGARYKVRRETEAMAINSGSISVNLKCTGGPTPIPDAVMGAVGDQGAPINLGEHFVTLWLEPGNYTFQAIAGANSAVIGPTGVDVSKSVVEIEFDSTFKRLPALIEIETELYLENSIFAGGSLVGPSVVEPEPSLMGGITRQSIATDTDVQALKDALAQALAFHGGGNPGWGYDAGLIYKRLEILDPDWYEATAYEEVSTPAADMEAKVLAEGAEIDFDVVYSDGTPAIPLVWLDTVTEAPESVPQGAVLHVDASVQYMYPFDVRRLLTGQPGDKGRITLYVHPDADATGADNAMMYNDEDADLVTSEAADPVAAFMLLNQAPGVYPSTAFIADIANILETVTMDGPWRKTVITFDFIAATVIRFEWNIGWTGEFIALPAEVITPPTVDVTFDSQIPPVATIIDNEAGFQIETSAEPFGEPAIWTPWTGGDTITFTEGPSPTAYMVVIKDAGGTQLKSVSITL